MAAVAAIAASSAAPLAAQDSAPTNPCQVSTCMLVVDWGGKSAPDVDRVYGGPADMESALLARLGELGFHMVQSGAALTMTLRPTPQTRVICDALPGTSSDYSCHTVSRAQILFTSNDSSMKAPSRIDINPRCSDVKSFPTFHQFGEFAGEWIGYAMAGQKGQRPQVKCR